MFLGKDKDGKATIYINENIAAVASATNVLGHELFHYMISRRFKTDNASMAPFINELKSYLQNYYLYLETQIHQISIFYFM